MAKKNKPQPSVKELLSGFGEKIRAYRWDKRLTLDNLAKEAGISTVLLAQIEKNELDNISMKKVLAVANAIGSNVSLSFEEVPPRLKEKEKEAVFCE